MGLGIEPPTPPQPHFCQSGWLTLAKTLDFSELLFLISEKAVILPPSLTSCNCYEVDAQPPLRPSLRAQERL